MSVIFAVVTRIHVVGSESCASVTCDGGQNRSSLESLPLREITDGAEEGVASIEQDEGNKQSEANGQGG
jgi:hypothetical protein